MSNEANKKEASNKLTMTLPPVVIAALAESGKEFDMSAGEYWRQMAIMAYAHPEGIHIKLKRVVKDAAVGHPELPLGS